MKKNKITPVISAALIGLSSMAFMSCSDNNDDSNPIAVEQTMEQTIVELAQQNEDLETLVVALEKAELVETLNGTDKFTVFAPTDEVFDALPDGALDALLADPTGDLKEVLLNHVISGEVRAEQVVTLTEAMTVGGVKISIEVVDGKVILNGNIEVTSTDIKASNGVIHLINGVLLPTEAVVEESELKSIGEIAAGNEDFETLTAALKAAKLDGVLSGEGEFTVFAPTDAAFEALGETVATLLEDPEGELKDILLGHVVGSIAKAEDVVGLTEVTTLSGEKVMIEVKDGKVILNGTSMVVTTDIMASNGVIHVIDAVLLPAAEELMSIGEIAAGNDDFETLTAALKAAKLDGVLSGEGEFTVFAPTDAAFEALGETVATLLEDPEGQLKNILLYHVVSGIAKAEDVVGLTEVTTLEGQKVTIEVKDGKVILNGTAMVVTTDITASNGVIHVLDAVITPPTITDIVVGSDDFETLEAAVVAADLATTLSDITKQFTVFAPTDAAFDKLPAGTLDALLEDPKGDLKNILLYHVVDGSVKAETVVTLTNANTLLNQEVSIKVQDGKVYLNDTVMVTATDIQAGNGIIHVIDAVLIP